MSYFLTNPLPNTAFFIATLGLVVRRFAGRMVGLVAASLAACLLLLSTAVTAQGSPSLAEANSLKIGLIGPFTGPSADFGIPMRNGVQHAVDEINAAGGYLGRRLTLVIKDDQGNPDTGLRLSNELIAEKVIATVGFCNTGVAAKALEVFQTAKVPLIIPCATGTALTARFPAPESYIFRTSARDAIQAPFVVNDILKRGWDKVAIFADETGYGEGGLKDVVAALAAKNVKPVFIGRFPLGVKDLSEPLKKAREAGANVVFHYTVGPENAVLALSREAIGWKAPIVGPWTLSFPFFLDGAKAAAEGALTAQTFIAEPSNERRAAFITSHVRRFKLEKMSVPMSSAQGYDSVYILMYALFNIRDGKLTGPAIKAALETKNRIYYGVLATYERPFTLSDKDAITPNMLVMGQIKNGAITFAYPEDAKRNLFVQRKQP